MNIESQDAAAMMRRLEDAQQKGYRYVNMERDPQTGAAKMESLHFFRDKNEANYAAYLAMSVHQKHVEALPVKEVLDVMQRQTELFRERMNAPYANPGMVLDTGSIRYAENARLETAVEDLARKLKDQQIQPDVRLLREYVMADKHDFSIGGVKMDGSEEKKVQIHIQQNNDRSFEIRSVDAQQGLFFNKSMDRLRQEELLGGRLHPEEAGPVKKMLQELLELGKAYVSIQHGQSRLNHQHFNGFDNALQAVDHVRQQSKESQVYIVRSTDVVMKEVDRVLENKQGISKQVESRLPAIIEKKGKGTELSM